MNFLMKVCPIDEAKKITENGKIGAIEKEIERVNEEIKRAAANGKTYVSIDDLEYKETKLAFKNAGYMVEERDDEWEETTVFYWHREKEEKKEKFLERVISYFR